MTARFNYTLFATHYPSGRVGMYITTGRSPTQIVPEDTDPEDVGPEDIDKMWNNILECFAYAELEHVAKALHTLPA